MLLSGYVKTFEHRLTTYSRHNSVLGYKLHRYRITIALAFVIPTIAGNIILWKSPRDNKAALLGGLYIVCIDWRLGVKAN
jgi:hypothetical protein